MDTKSLVEKVCTIPLDAYRLELSPAELLRRSGYQERPDAFTRQNAEAYLKVHPFLIEHWLQWSEDQRSHPAWVFGKGEIGYFVYRIPACDVDLTFDSGFEACAEFICRWASAVTDRG